MWLKYILNAKRPVSWATKTKKATLYSIFNFENQSIINFDNGMIASSNFHIIKSKTT